MSDDATGGGRTVSPESITETLRRWYHIPAILVVFGFMLGIRIESWSRFISGSRLYFAGNDPWYHFRMIEYAVSHSLTLQPYEVWTGFTYGTNSGQFGTLFDQLIATAALLIGFGDPSTHQVALTVLFAPPVIGALLAIPTFLIGRRLGGTLSGIFAAVILALLPGLFLQRGLVGSADHNVAEPLFQSFAVLGLLISVSVAEKERPIWEQFQDRDFEGLRAVLAWGTLAGGATAFYMWMWPPGVLLVGIFGVFLLLKLTSDFYSGNSPDHVAIAGVISMGTTAALMALPLNELRFASTGFTLLQVLFPLGVAAGAGFLSFLGREWERRHIAEMYYPPTVALVLLVGAGLFALLLPDLFHYIYSNLIRIAGFTTGSTTRTIGEAQPFPTSRAAQLGLEGWQVIFLEYGTAFFTALIAAVWMLLKPHVYARKSENLGLIILFVGVTALFVTAPGVPQAIGNIFLLSGDLTGLFIVALLIAALLIYEAYPAHHTLVLIWSGFILAAAFTQVRFNYYLVVPVAVLNAYGLKEVISLLGIDRSSFDVRDVEASHVLVIATVLVLVLAPLVAPVSFANQNGQQIPMQNAWETGQNTGPGAVTRWDPTLRWMANNTPAEGDYGNANNDDLMEYYGTYKTPPDGDFDYPAGSYGVMSWWDYGHWITVRGERIPVANPFQQNARPAANYLLAPSEQRANDVLASIDEDDAKTRYVAVDWKMVAPQSKFGAPVVFYSENETLTRSDMIRGRIYNPQGQNWINIKTQRYYESQMVRLYRYHGSARKAQPVVLDYESRTYNVQGQQVQVPTFNGTRQFRTMEAARNYTRTDPTSSIGGFSDYPEEDVPALEHYRLVKASGQYLAPTNYLQNAEFNYGNFPTWVKLFERVPGATIQGTAPPNTTVQAKVEMAIQFPQRPGTFNYTQYAQTGPDGEFTMTLPYSTTGYENWGPENGYTNVSVRATGPYTFTGGTSLNASSGNITRWRGTADVPEAAVIGEDTGTISVDLEQEVIGNLGGNNPQNSTDTGAENSTDTSSGTQNGSVSGTDNTTTNQTSISTTVPTVTGTDGTVDGAEPAANQKTIPARAKVGE